jgi:hypothetical protein
VRFARRSKWLSAASGIGKEKDWKISMLRHFPFPWLRSSLQAGGGTINLVEIGRFPSACGG